MNHLLSNNSMLILGADGEFFSVQNSIAGWPEMYQQFQMDIAGAAQIPVTRLFGRTQTGLGQSNDADERIYEEKIAVDQEDQLRPQLDKLYPVLCMSELGEIPDDLDLAFPSIRVLDGKEKAELATQTTNAVISLANAGLIDKAIALKELKQQSDITGFGTNITDEEIEAAIQQEAMLPEIPTGMGEEPAPGEEEETPRATDAFRESEHPREKGGKESGQFAPKGGGGGTSGTLQSAPRDRAQWPEHIQSLKLPPAWTDVRINPDADADLLAVGKDSKGRPQYVYSQRFQNSQAEAKFARIKELDKKFEKVRRQNTERLSSEDPRTRSNAHCARLVMVMGVRPGSDAATKAKTKAYGATTLEGRHVVVEGDETYLRFTGKKGVAINLQISDPELAEDLRNRSEQAGGDGRLFPGVTDKSLLDYTHSLNGGGFKTKDFRTLIGTRSAMEEVSKAAPPKTEKEYKKRVLEVAKSVSTRLGNTPTVALQSYINPVVFAPWRSAYAAA